MAKIVEHNVQPNQYNNNSTNMDDRQKNGLAIDNEEDAMKYLTSNPFLEKAMGKMIQQSIAEENTNAAKGKSMVTPLNSPQKGTDVIPVNGTSGNKTGKDNTLLKSPSDTTLYAPALRKLPPNTCVTNKDELIDRISNFVEEIHFEGDEQRRESGVSRRKMPDVRPTRNQTVEERIATIRPPQAQRELMEADRLVIEAEQFNATVEAPKGNNNTVVDSIGVHKMRVVMTITSTSHVMLILFYVIRSKGVNSLNLNVCYPKGVFKEDNRLEWVSKDGMTFLALVQDRDTKITNVRKWDQSFRVYAAVYCNANPSRAGEIWQYIYTINSAASSFQ